MIVKYLAAIALGMFIALVSLTPAAASGNYSRTHRYRHYPAYYPHRRATYRYVSARPYYSGGATGAIAAASARWGVSYGWLLRVAECESSLNPGAYNGYSGASGLFQFMPGTYWMYAARIGEGRSYWNADGAANVAAYMFHMGQSYQWSCR